ncbi:hypothetical protein [Arthrobacter oryzae]|jgi:hypothetical protein|uniref:hypothetical protein n=1 Tax=Arthrobacter oryzae TaxID=409290 RepID=UPI0027827913|nr:hypothetical protein [Arthrobacter oryzae]MDQ0078734.1 hypothetical protein [Arthrobacter oryzae]
MGGTLRDCCLVALRPFLFAVLLTVAWLAWAAGSANAASEDPNPLAAIEQGTVSLLQETGSTLAPAIKDVPAPVAAVPFPVSGTATAVVDVVDPVLGEASDAVAAEVNKAAPPPSDTDKVPADTVTDTVSDTADTVVSGVDSLAPSLPGVQPTLPVPTVPIPTVPGPQVPLPETPVHIPEVTVPGRSPVTTVPRPGFDAVTEAPAGIDLETTARSVSHTARHTGAAQQPARRAVSPLEFLANTQALRAMAATIGYAVSAAPAPANAPEPERVFRFAVLQNQSGSAAAGTGSAGAEASSDVAEFWSNRHDDLCGLMPDAALILAASPSFDPGSSPD